MTEEKPMKLMRGIGGDIEYFCRVCMKWIHCRKWGAHINSHKRKYERATGSWPTSWEEVVDFYAKPDPKQPSLDKWSK